MSYMQTAAEAAAAEAADEAEEDDADADDTRYRFAPCDCSVLPHNSRYTRGCAVPMPCSSSCELSLTVGPAVGWLWLAQCGATIVVQHSYAAVMHAAKGFPIVPF